MNPAYTYGEPMEQHRQFADEKSHQSFTATDQFGGEMKYFSNCILNNEEPEPNGEEGMADVRVIEAILKACESGGSVKIEAVARTHRIATDQQVEKLSTTKPPKPINAKSPSE